VSAEPRAPLAAAQPALWASRARILPARLEDVGALESFIAAYTHDGTLLPRSHANLLRHLPDFRVVRVKSRLVGCGALQRVDAGLAEVRSVAVDPAFRGQGLGGRIVRALLGDARRLGLARVFCLTRRVEFFARLGFAVAPVERFPHKVWNDCRLCPRRDRCDETAMEVVLVSRL
jgi:N-acetylglutamate synthase-like GNAT family acetyltransferase